MSMPPKSSSCKRLKRRRKKRREKSESGRDAWLKKGLILMIKNSLMIVTKTLMNMILREAVVLVLRILKRLAKEPREERGRPSLRNISRSIPIHRFRPIQRLRETSWTTL